LISKNQEFIDKVAVQFKPKFEKALRFVFVPKKRGDGFKLNDEGIRELEIKAFSKGSDATKEEIFNLAVASWTKTGITGGAFSMSACGLLLAQFHDIPGDEMNEITGISTVFVTLYKNQDEAFKSIMNPCDKK